MKKNAFDGLSLITRGALVVGGIDPRHADLSDKKSGNELVRLGLALAVAQERIVKGRNPSKIVQGLTNELHRIRNDVAPHVWRSLVPVAQNHPVCGYLLQDPLTRWSFEKPRGYSGDAELIDLIYRHPSVDRHIAESSLLGHAIYNFTSEVSSSVAVRERRDLLTKLVDEIAAARGDRIDILTVAAGHLREAENSAALRDGKIGRWIALDQDPLTVGTVMRDFAGTPIDARDGSVRGILKNSYKLGRFDVIYAAGLYDYLPRKVAISLTRACMKMLKPEGQFLFANFAKHLRVDGYMDTFMDWPILFRDEIEMWDIINSSVDRNTSKAKVYRGTNRSILYARIHASC